MNNVFIKGILVRDTETKILQSGTMLLVNSLAVDVWRNNNGNFEKVNTYFFKLQMFTKKETEFSRLKKGDKVIVEGSLAQSKWEDNNGNKRDMVFITVKSISKIQKAEKVEKIETYDEDTGDVPF